MQTDSLLNKPNNYLTLRMIYNLFKNESPVGNTTLVHPTREMVLSRTIHLASIEGREAHQIKQCDYEQAKRELTGESNFDRQQSVLDARWGERC